MTKLVDDLLEVSRITAGRVELREEPVDLRAAVERYLTSSGRRGARQASPSG